MLVGERPEVLLLSRECEKFFRGVEFKGRDVLSLLRYCLTVRWEDREIQTGA